MWQHTSTPKMLAFPELSSATNPRALGLHKAGCLGYCNSLGTVDSQLLIVLANLSKYM